MFRDRRNRQLLFYDLGAVLSEHKAEIKAALKGASLGIHGVYCGKEYFIHASFCNSLGVEGIWSDGSHSAGVKSLVAVESALMVHGRNHGNNGFSVGEGKHRNLGSLKEFLDYDFVSAVAEFLVLHDFLNGRKGLLALGRNDDALSESKSVGLYDGGNRSGFKILEGGGGVGKDLVFCRGNAVFFHEIF